MRPLTLLVFAVLLVGCSQNQALPGEEPRNNQNEDEAITSFWSWFDGAKERIGRPSYQRDTVMEVGDQIHKINPDLTFEIGLATDPKEFVVSGGGLKSMIPVVEKVVAAAPPIAGWKIVAFKQPRSLEESSQTMYGSVTLGLDQVKYTLTEGQGLPSLTLYVHGYQDSSSNDVMGAGFVLLDSLLGEYNVMTRVGPITFEPLVKAPPNAKPLANLREDFR